MCALAASAEIDSCAWPFDGICACALGNAGRPPSSYRCHFIAVPMRRAWEPSKRQARTCLAMRLQGRNPAFGPKWAEVPSRFHAPRKEPFARTHGKRNPCVAISRYPCVVHGNRAVSRAQSGPSATDPPYRAPRTRNAARTRERWYGKVNQAALFQQVDVGIRPSSQRHLRAGGASLLYEEVQPMELVIALVNLATAVVGLVSKVAKPTSKARRRRHRRRR